MLKSKGLGATKPRCKSWGAGCRVPAPRQAPRLTPKDVFPKGNRGIVIWGSPPGLQGLVPHQGVLCPRSPGKHNTNSTQSSS